MTVKNDEVWKLINSENSVNLDNIVEITKYSTTKNGKVYAGIDKDSAPGNFNINNVEDKTCYEDDTSRAPGLTLVLCEERKTSGVVFLDHTTEETQIGEERLGDGIYKDIEDKGINDVAVTLYEAKETQNLITGVTQRKIAKYYDTSTKKWKEATFKTKDNGLYEIGGYLPGEYKVEFTWGGQTVNGENITVQDYKSTIVDKTVWKAKEDNKEWYKDSFKQQYQNTSIKEWEGGKENRTSDALDDMQIREEIDKQLNGTITYQKAIEEIATTEMKSYSPEFKVSIETRDDTNLNNEYEYKNGTLVFENGYIKKKADYTNNINSLDFGIVERARQAIELNKTVKKLNLSLGNGQSLVDVDIDEHGNMTEGQKYITYIKPDANREPKAGLLRLEIDNEIIQSSKLAVSYELKANNKSELDYLEKDYYKYGINGAKKVTIRPDKVIDYLDRDWEFDSSKNQNDWTVKDLLYLKEITEKHVTGNNSTINDKIIIETGSLGNTPIEPGKSSAPVILNVSRILANTDEIELENETEIIEIYKNGGIGIKTIPGNYVPGTGKTEDDDSTAQKIVVTPNTGDDKAYIIPIVIGATALLVLGGGIIIIKKKVIE